MRTGELERLCTADAVPCAATDVAEPDAFRMQRRAYAELVRDDVSLRNAGEDDGDGDDYLGRS